MTEQERPTFWEYVAGLQPIGVVLGVLAGLFPPTFGEKVEAFLFMWFVFFVPFSIVWALITAPFRGFADDLRGRNDQRMRDQ